jgi:hypothetical protein
MMIGFERYRKKIRQAVVLEEMEQVVPWRELCALIERHYLKPGSGRPRRSGWNGCCEFTFCSSGSICQIREWKRCCTNRR